MNRSFKSFIFTLLLSLFVVVSVRSEVLHDIAYKHDAATKYERERCKIDLHLPDGKSNFATVVWFHGGSLTSGQKADDIATAIAKRLNARGVAVASVNYRLSPKATFPAYVVDGAAAVAWVRKNIEAHDGDADRVFVSGHSAGGYLAAMIGMDARFLAAHDLKPGDFAGYIPVAGQMITHSTVREERGIRRTTPLIDAAAPVAHVRADQPPFLNIFGDDDLPARAEENIYFAAASRAAGAGNVRTLLVENRDHGTVASFIGNENDPALEAILEFMNVNAD